tara:strand:- start:393 stop:866 length:474 start_codon:yes stop_codon:yes gene_type:complete
MKNTILLTLFLFVLGCEKEDGLAPNEIMGDEGQFGLQIEVSGFEDLDGNLAIAVFDNEEEFDSGQSAYLDTVLPVVAYEMSVYIESVDPGFYAVSVFHDADQSGDITLGGFLNLVPQEGFGFSNNPDIGMSQPNYGDCDFEFSGDQLLLVPIDLVYF